LKKVDAQSVAEAMVEVFSRTGLPDEILTDQGGVFLSALCKQMCELLQIKALRTSPYHPQSDGMLERWHASLKSMLKMAQGDRKDWDASICFLHTGQLLTL
jgi:transposase InsO family protein